MNTNNRLFLPLKSAAFEWFAEGNKKYELRKLHHQYNCRQVKEGRLVELRRGYSGASIWGTIGQVLVESNLHKLFKTVEFKRVIPVAFSIDEAVSIAEKFVGTEGPYILFEILKNEDINALKVQDIKKNVTVQGVYEVKAFEALQKHSVPKS